MLCTTKTIVAPFDFTTRFVKNFVTEATSIKSNLYFLVSGDSDRRINAKSILGLISANIKQGYEVEVFVYGNSQEQVDKDLQKVYDLIVGDEN